MNPKNLETLVPQSKVSLAWQNLRYEIADYLNFRPTTKPILRRLNGFFECHSLNGLMGPSGSGKTTLALRPGDVIRIETPGGGGWGSSRSVSSVQYLVERSLTEH